MRCSRRQPRNGGSIRKTRSRKQGLSWSEHYSRYSTTRRQELGRAEEGKHVLMLTQYFAPDIAGGAFRMATLYRYLRDEGCDVDVITAVPHKGSVEEVAADAHVHRVRVS